MIKTANLTASVSRQAGGLFDSVRRLVQALAHTGMHVRVLGTQDAFTRDDLTSWDPVHVSAFPPAWPRQFAWSPGFLKELLPFQPDLLHTHGIWQFPSLATLRYSRSTHCPYVISPHGMLDPWAIQNSRWKKAIAYPLYERAHLRGANCLRALCEPEARAFRRLGLKNPIAIIPNGIDLPVLEDYETTTLLATGPLAEDGGPSTEEARRRMEDRGWQIESGGWKAEDGRLRTEDGSPMADGRKVLLYLGRLHPKKGLVNLIRAWDLALSASPAARTDWVLAIAGWDQGGHEAELKRLATDLGLPWTDVPPPPSAPSVLRPPSSVIRRPFSALLPLLPIRAIPVIRGKLPFPAFPHSLSALRPPSSVLHPPSSLPRPPSLLFLGPQFGAAKAACYANCDAFILPSFSEGLPMAVLEAWAYAKPVLMTPECNLADAFAAGAALRIEPNIHSIQRGLLQLLSAPPASRAALGAAGRTLAAARFEWSRIALDTKQLYEWILGGGSRPASIADF